MTEDEETQERQENCPHHKLVQENNGEPYHEYWSWYRCCDCGKTWANH
jgi:hypothetical protein